MDEELARVRLFTGTSHVGKSTEMLGLFADALDESASGLGIVALDVCGDGVEILKGSPEPPNLHTWRRCGLPLPPTRTCRRRLPEWPDRDPRAAGYAKQGIPRRRSPRHRTSTGR